MNERICNSSSSYFFNQSEDKSKPDTNEIIQTSNDNAINKLNCINFKVIKLNSSNESYEMKRNIDSYKNNTKKKNNCNYN